MLNTGKVRLHSSLWHPLILYSDCARLITEHTAVDAIRFSTSDLTFYSFANTNAGGFVEPDAGTVATFVQGAHASPLLPAFSIVLIIILTRVRCSFSQYQGLALDWRVARFTILQ